MPKKIALITICLFAAAAFSSCKVDVNKLVQSEAESSSQISLQSMTDSSSEEDTDTHTDMFYTSGAASEAEDEESEFETDSEVDAFDEEQYLTMFVSGAAEIPLTADALYGSKEVGSVKSGDRVSIVQSNVMEYCFVYNKTIEKFGYIRTEYLADYLEETTIGNVYYVKPAQTAVYKDRQLTEKLEDVVQNDMLTVLVKCTGGQWRVSDKNGSIGYIDCGLLSEKKIKSESSKSESETESKKKSKNESKTENNQGSETESKVESKTESKIESKTESKTESKADNASEAASSEEETVSAAYTGKGDPPEVYTAYIVDVDVGYLSLRNAPSADKSKVIGELYYEERVYVIDTSGDFWYIYAPSLGMYGYVTGDYNYLYPEYYEE